MSGTGQTPLKIEVEAGIAILTLCRPEKLNALNTALIDELAVALRVIERDASVRVVIVTGDGSKAFCAGGDINDWSAHSPVDFGRRWLRDGHQVFDALARLRQPVIAVLNGHALGGGLELAACADIRIAETHIKIGLPETGLGVIPGWSGTQRATRRFGGQIVRRIVLFGEMLDAEAALALGAVDYLTPSGEGLQKAKELAARVLHRAPVATELCKMLINAAEGEDRERAIEAMAGMAAASTDDLREGVAAYREKRKADFRGL
ncbi:enoyl-CoA hydratase/isomerase family protein [Rhizobium sp. KVB221]|uniref:Enoyl-CoA hydratase/isomerase family protein n=1 Tax=Rhizobium setariae TaxID=2801340 RepID=A0A937CRS7_9HYPH|nr:enoyl-CoA hydratase/isomerase family protein [Rhizobium setariae]MBL0375172.1 enoyl-CoA hydratase/isomerase family protein [Rhizobium setariae]